MLMTGMISDLAHLKNKTEIHSLNGVCVTGLFTEI